MTTGELFDIPIKGLRVVVTGQVGIDKKPFLEQVIELGDRTGADRVKDALR